MAGLSDPALLKKWWCPKPWTTDVRAFDMRPGGAFHTFMQGPDGGTSDNPGSFLEVVPQQRIVFSSLLLAGWRPATPWMAFTAIITMADEGEGTRYVATVMHPTGRRPSRRDGILRRLEYLHDQPRRSPASIRPRSEPTVGARHIRARLPGAGRQSIHAAVGGRPRPSGVGS